MINWSQTRILHGIPNFLGFCMDLVYKCAHTCRQTATRKTNPTSHAIILSYRLVTTYVSQEAIDRVKYRDRIVARGIHVEFSL